METTTTEKDDAPGVGLIRSRSAILAARSRNHGQRSDGGSTGRSDTND